MNCPTCGHGDHRVLRTDEADDRIARMRECLSCGKRWKTAEVDVEVFERATTIAEAFQAMKSAIPGEA